MRAPTSLRHPRHWPSWMLVGLLRLLALLPLRVALALGAGLGRSTWWLLPGRRHITRVNLAIAFPERSEAEREALGRAHFAAVGMGMIELISCWWAPERRLRGRYEIEGGEHLERALAAGQGVILLSAHFTSLELATRLLCQRFPVTAMYKPHRNPVFRHVMQAGRDTHADVQTIPFNDVRGMLRAIKAGKIVWYAPDQSRRIKFSAVLPFFGHPAVTNIATSRIARMTKAPVVPFFMYRETHPEGGPYWRLVIAPPLPEIPSGDDEADAVRINALFEGAARRAPEQYLWMHRKFKGLPGRDVYARNS